MRSSTCREIRAVLRLPAPKLMSPSQRQLYRGVKRAISRLPHNQRRAKLDAAVNLHDLIKAKLVQATIAAGHAAQSSSSTT